MSDDHDQEQSGDAAEAGSAEPGSAEPGGDGGHGDEVDFASYVFPDTRQRRISAYAFFFLSAVAIVLWLLRPASGGISYGLLIGAVVLLFIGVYFLLAAFPMQLDQGEALIQATKVIGFPVGHASAVLGWRGWRARPTWRILMYSVEDPPKERGLVEIDAQTGDVLASYHEDNPEDWDALRREEDERPG